MPSTSSPKKLHTPPSSSEKKARPRHDGWTKERRAQFLDVLGYSGCVRDACAVAGMTSTSAYRLRRSDAEFDAAWKVSLARAQKGLEAVAYKRAVEGRETIIIRKGEEVERRITPSDSILSLLIKRGKMNEADAAADAETVLTWEEFNNNWRFSSYGGKYQVDDPAKVEAILDARMQGVRARLEDYAKNGGGCPCCRQKLPEGWPKASIMEMQILGVINTWDWKDGWGALGPTRTRPEPIDVFIPPLQ